MALVIGLLVPWAILALAGFRRDGETHWRFYLAPALFAVLSTVAVLTTDAGNTPDFWIGLSAGLAGLVAAGMVLVLQSFMPLNWWLRHPVESYSTTDAIAASSSGRAKE